MLQFLLSHMAEFSPSVTLKIFLWIYVDGGMQIDTFCFKKQTKRRHANDFGTYKKDGQNVQIGTTVHFSANRPGQNRLPVYNCGIICPSVAHPSEVAHV